MKINLKIFFILPVSTQPRYTKRISGYLKRGYFVKVASFQREYFSKNKLPDGIELTMLDKIENGAYFKRIPILLRNIIKLFKLSEDADNIYIFSPDILFPFAFFSKSKALTYEMGDIREFSKNHILKGFFNKIYRRALLKCTHIVVTSIKFKEHLINKYQVESTSIHVIENKLEPDVIQSIQNRWKFPNPKKPISLGIIGLLRYKNVTDFLSEFKKSKADFIVHIYGGGPLETEIRKLVDNVRIFYHGQFKYPDDLSKIYDNIDISFTMYDVTQLNVRLALPNKLYESMVFKRPIIVTKGTYLGEVVSKYGIGFEWDQNDMHGLVEYLESEDFSIQYRKLEPNFLKIKESDYSN